MVRYATLKGRLHLPPPLPAPDFSKNAAQYIRMSTDQQVGSPINQRDAIAQFAEQRGLTIIHTYSDEGCSGLSAEGRPELLRLIDEITSGRAEFRTVLVYDVSRWGRFQNCDESAFYEFLCFKAGIKVEYCAEPFANDASPLSAIVKSIKRIMAGEYSRELSEKVTRAKRRFAQMGYRQGALACYGLRRAVVDAAGLRQRVLQLGEHKYLSTDRIVLEPGPPHETRVVRWIFEQVASRGRKFRWIADSLNRRGVPCVGGRPWCLERLRKLVSNEQYIGNSIYNQTSTRLRSPKVCIPPEHWIRVEGTHEAIVSTALFQKAQAAMAGWNTRMSNEVAIERLREVLRRHGTLSTKIIAGEREVPSAYFYESRFGSLVRAYEAAGFVPAKSFAFLDGYTTRRRRLTTLRKQIVETFKSRGIQAWNESPMVQVVGTLRLVVQLGRCVCIEGNRRWHIQVPVKPPVDWVLVERLAESGEILDYWLLKGGPKSYLLDVKYRKPRERHQGLELQAMLELLASKVGPVAYSA